MVSGFVVKIFHCMFIHEYPQGYERSDMNVFFAICVYDVICFAEILAAAVGGAVLATALLIGVIYACCRR